MSNSPTPTSPAPGANIPDRFQGCLLGGAVGDALGAPIEFMSLETIRARFGPAGIRDFAPAYGRRGAITDDTQMTLFTAEAMIRSWMRDQTSGLSSPEDITARAYARWLITQGEKPPNEPCDFANSARWLFKEKALHSRRAPGNTCLSSLRVLDYADAAARNSSKGCGAVMRMAPVGLAGWRFGWDSAYVLALGANLGRLTHGHPTGYLSAGAFAALVFELLKGSSLEDATGTVVELLGSHEGHQETVMAIDQARNAAAGNGDRMTVPLTLGEEWIGEEALAIGLYCALVAPDLEEGVILAANIGGDSDSTGAIAGNLLGAVHGAAAVPARWIEQLELKEVIGTLADDLYDCVDWKLSGPMDRDVSAVSQRHHERYPPN